MSRRRRSAIDLEIKSKRKRQGSPDPAMQRALRGVRRQHTSEIARERNNIFKESQISPQEQRRQQIEQVKVNVSQKQNKNKPTVPKATKVTKTITPKPSTVLREQLNQLEPKTFRTESKSKLDQVVEQTIQPLKVSQPQLRYEKLVDKVNSINDVNQLRKILYNRNYRLKQNYLKEHPEALQLKYIMVNDIRHVKPTTFKRLSAIKDPQKQIEALRKLIIDTTRKVNKPKSIADYSNKEQEYMKNAIYQLQSAIGNWDVGREFRDDLNRVIEQITLQDIEHLFKEVPSYWAIGEGYYYAVADLNHFTTELIKIFEDKVDDAGNPIKVFTTEETKSLMGRLYTNEPHKNITE